MIQAIGPTPSPPTYPSNGTEVGALQSEEPSWQQREPPPAHDASTHSPDPHSDPPASKGHEGALWRITKFVATEVAKVGVENVAVAVASEFGAKGGARIGASLGAGAGMAMCGPPCSLVFGVLGAEAGKRIGAGVAVTVTEVAIDLVFQEDVDWSYATSMGAAAAAFGPGVNPKIGPVKAEGLTYAVGMAIDEGAHAMSTPEKPRPP